MQKRGLLKKLGVMLFAAVLTIVPAASAQADNNNLPDPAKAGSITLHKYLRDVESTTLGTGKELTAAEEAALGTPGKDIAFTLYKVNSTYAVTDSTTVAQALANATIVSKEITDTNGRITWSWPTGAAGYYVLVEDASTTPAGYTASPNTIIALPYAVNDDVWNYDIHVYPKNVTDKPLIKTVPDPKALGYSVGDTVTWKYTAKADVSNLYKAGTPDAYGTYKITDTLDSRLAYKATTAVNAIGGVSSVALVAGTDYNVDSTTTAGTVVWSLTEAGIKKMADAKATGVEVAFETTVLDTAYGQSDEATIKNGGKLEWKNTNGDDQTPYEIPEDDKPEVELYNIVIKKTNNDGTKLLDGAQFKIATSEANAKAGTFLQSNGVDVSVTTKAHPTDTAITGGWAMFAGLAVNPTSDTTFWLVEDVAPTVGTDKYIRPGEPIEVTIKNTTGATNAEKLSTTATIKNYLPTDPDVPEKWKLPMTGGMGTVMFYVIGAIVMIGSVMLFVRTKKTKAAK